ncbi:MAG: hypothetical protein AAB443_02880 [Patescibacteria group bacterium]
MKGLFTLSALYLLFCFFTYTHFGITSDEYVEYQSGKALLHYYITGKEPTGFDISSRHLPKNSTYFRGHLALTSFLNPLGSYELFHLYNMLFALPVFLIFYLLLLFVYKNTKLASLGTFALFFTPRFLGDIPANTKDVPFAVSFFVSLGFIYFFDKVKVNFFVKIITLGTLFGLTSSFRLLGVSLFIIHLLYSLKNSKLSVLRESFLVFFVSLAVLVISLPLFSEGILEGFKTLIQSASNFEYWDNKMLFLGEFISKNQRPWYYLPVWLVITTPLYILIPFLLSPIALYLRKSKDNDLYVLMYFALLINFTLYLLIEPVIYNGLRHFLFLVPIISFISVLSLFDLLDCLKKYNVKIRYVFGMLLVFLFSLTVKSFITLHPYQYVYFNEVINGLKGAQGRFDSDYWGTSYKASSDWVQEKIAKTESVTVYSCDMAFAVNYYSQKLFQVVFVEENADFILCDLDNALQKVYDLPILYKVERGGVPLNVVLDHRKFKPVSKQ